MMDLAKLKELESSHDMKLGILRDRLIREEHKVDVHSGVSKNCNKCIILFQDLISKVLDSNVTSLSDLISSGLEFVIDDQTVSFRIDQEFKNNRTNFKFNVDTNGLLSDPVDGSGGGVATLISTILRFSMTTKFGLSKLILLDESLSSLSNAYVPAASEFLKKLSKEFGIDILMVTHNADFIEAADISYEAMNDGKLKLKRLK